MQSDIRISKEIQTGENNAADITFSTRETLFAIGK